MSGGPDKIQVKYEELEYMMRLMHHMADKMAQKQKIYRYFMREIEEGAWLGEAATAHHHELRDEILPALQRLHDVYADIANALDQARMQFQEAEQDAAAKFREGPPTGGSAFAGASAGASASVGVTD
jgi:WXG100 family type VII secretion target